MTIDTKEIITIFFTIFIVVDPLGLIPVFIAYTAGYSQKKKPKIVVKAFFTALFVLTIFILFGRDILRFLGIKPGSFYIAGGILLFIVSMDLLLGHRQRTKLSEMSTEGEDVSIFPLGIPTLAGPGTITTILLFVSETNNQVETELVLFFAVLAALLVALLTMFLSNFFLKIFRETGVSIIQRLMGIILSGLSVQFVYEGIVKLGFVAS